MTEIIPNLDSVTPSRPARNRLGVAGYAALSVLAAWALIAILGPLVAPYSPADIVSDDNFSKPGSQYLLGTDYIGRDVGSRLIYGAQSTLLMSITATFIAEALGIYLGFWAALKGGYVDAILSRLNDALLSFPHIMMGLVVIAALGSSIPVLIVTSGLVYASPVFRIARALAMELRDKEFVEAARARGEGTIWILFREILPNTKLPLMTDAAMRLSFIIIFISSLGFLGLGVQPPAADWGSMVRENMEGLASGSLAPIIAAASIASVTVALNLLVDETSQRLRGRRKEGGK